MNRNIHSLLGVLLALVLVLSGLPAALAAQTADLITLDETTNLAVIVRYQTQEPEVAFLSPGGAQFSEAEGNLTVERGDKILYFHISQAQPGLWQIVYDKKDEQELTVNFIREASAVTLSGLTAQPSGTDGAQVAFQADFPRDVSCNYTIYAAVLSSDGQVSAQRELISGYTYTNRPVELYVPFYTLSSYDNYRLMVEVWLDDNGIETGDRAVFSEVFAYQNPSTPSAPGNVELTVDLAEQGLLADWTAWRDNSCDAYLLAFFKDDEAEPFFFQEYDRSITSAEVLVDTQVSSLRVELTYRQRGVMSQTLSRTVDLSQGRWLEIATPEETNAAQARINYALSAPTVVDVTINGENSQLTLEGESFFAVTLQDGVNQLSVSWSPTEALTFVASRQILCDRTPPLLRLFGVDGTLCTSQDSYLLAGQAEPGCTLQIAGRQVTLDADGTFLQPLPLSPGENTFSVELSDPAGNRTVQEVSVYRAAAGTISGGDNDAAPPDRLSFLPLLLTAAGSLVLLVLALALFRKGKDNNRRITLPVLILLWGLAALGLGGTGFCAFRYFMLYRQVNSPAFLETAQDSLALAYEQLQALGTLRSLALCLGVAALVLAVLALILTLVRRRQAKKPPKQQ